MHRPTIGTDTRTKRTVVPEPGDHVFVRRRLGYTHHGVAVSATEVIHFNGEPGSKSGATIRRSTLEEFAAGGRVRVWHYGSRLDAEETIRLAESKLGECGYHLFHSNCEHFAHWCATGNERSQQVSNATATGLAATNTAVGAVGTTVAVTTSGLAGTSGPAIMSGLASFGVGGVTGGLLTLAAAPTFGAVGVMHLALRDHDDLSDTDRKARRDGRRGTVAGAATVAAAIVPTLSTLGTAGLSGAGLTSALATAGSVAGGGMLAGSVMFAAAPAVAACAVGVGTYAVTKKVRARTPGRARS